MIRDRVGVKPLFYTKRGDTLIFASEIKGLFAYPGVKPVINREGLCEIFGLGPAKSYGKGVFKDIYEVLPGHFLEYDREGLKDRAYWELKAKEHTDSEKDTIEHTRWLVKMPWKCRCYPIFQSVHFYPVELTVVLSQQSVRKSFKKKEKFKHIFL